jgi:dTDP-glucose 4,6-dehydratase
MRVLVAGGAGFVGSHLVDRLIADGNDVVVVDDLCTGSMENLAHIDSRRLEVVLADAAQAPAIRDLDRVYNLASPASPEAYTRLSIETLMVNAVGTKRLLDIARDAGARFLLASTSEVYGDPLRHPQDEMYWGNVDPIGPRSQYDEGKRFAEALTVAYHRRFATDARIARIFNSYGPRMAMDDGRMPTAFIVAALRDDAIRVHGDGSQTRSLCYVEDTVAGLVAAMERGRAGDVYNVGRSDEISVLEFAERVRRAASSRSQIALVPGRSQDIHRRRPDPTKSKRELGWSPRTPLDVGLGLTIDWYRSRLAVSRGMAFALSSDRP